MTFASIASARIFCKPSRRVRRNEEGFGGFEGRAGLTRFHSLAGMSGRSGSEGLDLTAGTISGTVFLESGGECVLVGLTVLSLTCCNGMRRGTAEDGDQLLCISTGLILYSEFRSLRPSIVAARNEPSFSELT